MSDFSEYLDSYMEENSISSSDLSHETGIERTVIHRYRKGKRIPKKESFVKYIADALRMNTQERMLLMEQYDRLTIGDEMVNNYQYMKMVLEKMANVSIFSDLAVSRMRFSSLPREKEEKRMLEGKPQIISCLFHLFEEKRNKNSGALKLIMQPVYEPIQEMLQTFFRGSSVVVEQIICLEQNMNQNYKNLQIFQWLLPMCFESLNYEVFYYYDSLAHHINPMTLFPNLLFLDEYVVQFDFEMKRGILIKNKEYWEVQKAVFLEMKERSHSLFKRGTKKMESMEIFSSMGLHMDGTLFEQPCMARGICSQIYEEFLYDFPEKEEFIRQAQMRNGDWEDMKYIPTQGESRETIVSYCKPQGIRRFMQTGRLNEFPDTFYRPLNKEARKKVLRRCIQLIREKQLCFYFLPDEIRLPENTYFYWDDERKFIYMQYLGGEGIVQMAINEKSIYWAFQQFLEYLERKNMLITEKEVLQELEKIRIEF